MLGGIRGHGAMRTTRILLVPTLPTQFFNWPTNEMDTLKKMNSAILFFPILALAFGLFACSFFSNLGQPDIPASAQVGLKPGTSKVLGHFRLADWAAGVPPTAYFTVFEGRLTESDASEMRVFLSGSQSAQYIGALSNQLQLPGVKTLFIDLGGQRCIIGWVSPATQGKLLYFHLERPEADRKRWMEAEKESSIEKNMFIIPIQASDRPELWNFVSMSAVQTKESLQRGYDAKGSYYQVETTYSSPLDVSSFYIPISIQK